MWTLGLMSGTSLDGIDAAMIQTDGHSVTNFGHSAYMPYTDDDQKIISEATSIARKTPTGILKDRLKWPEKISQAEHLITRLHARAALHVIAQYDKKPELIGFHGQTFVHRPDEGFTLQVGDGEMLALALGIPVIYDFRSHDVACGGQGAPLAPLYHQALAPDGPSAFVNIGGVGNVTFVSKGNILAFDTGPGNALINDWVKRMTGALFDKDGKLGLAGKPFKPAIKEMLENPYFDRKPPKSLDRSDFSIPDILDMAGPEDGAATLVEFTARCIQKSVDWADEKPENWYICGGGRRNPAIMSALDRLLDGNVAPVENIGLDGDMLEAQAFAYLAVRSKLELPLSVPTTTGVQKAVSGGKTAYP